MVIWCRRSSKAMALCSRKWDNYFGAGHLTISQYRRCSPLRSVPNVGGWWLKEGSCLSRGAASTVVSVRFFRSTATGEQPEALRASDGGDDEQALDFPGGKVPCTSELRFIGESPERRAACYRVLDLHGGLIAGSNHKPVSKELAVKMYRNMATLEMMDTVFYEAQRQGRISFYMSCLGEEAINIGSAAALGDDDIVLPQYREPGILLWRGYTLVEFANQCFGNGSDPGKGRQMPVHYGSIKHNCVTISSPIATQLPQAAGIAYSLKMDRKDACAVAFIGDGGTSQGDFHAGLNFAAVLEAPVIFICRNNGWAISTHISEQFRSDGVVVKGEGYGVRSIRVDGNDALAVYTAVASARERAVTEQRPVLVEAMTYRVGHHSTSDDSTKYRPADEIRYWKTARSPVDRFRKWVQSNGWWSHQHETELRVTIKNQLYEAIQVAEKTEKPGLEELFSDVYNVTPANLIVQEKQLRHIVDKYPQDFPY